MKHDRQIMISVGTNRRDLNWRQTALTVAELYERLRNPIKSIESYADYMKMKRLSRTL